MSVVIETTLGDLTVDLFTDERPIACLNFIKLCQLKYYNFNLFHTVQQGFIAQTGDPNGSGDGGSSIWGVVEGAHKRFFEAEYIPKIHHSSAGLVSFVSAGKNLVASQFFFTLGENLTSLDGTHCVFGEVVEGHELLRSLNDAIVDDNFRPYQDIRITHTVVLEDPFPNPRGFQVPSRSPSPSAERLKNGRIAADEDIDDTDGKTMEEMQELLAEREAKARATILEIVGDLPDAEMAPPENVLFVCKLNPVTTDDDLEIIFSRFGVVKGCEVIRDRKTGDSLQYAFVEFDNQKSCEAAYFKMDNVLIDDRRIHVDFSQSVSKVTWRGKGRGVVGSDGKLDFNNLREKNGYSNMNKTREDGRNKAEYDQHNQRSRMSSKERRKARELRHQEQKDSHRSRDDNARRHRERSRSRDRSTQYRSRSRNRHTQRHSRSKDWPTQRRSRSKDRPTQRRSRSKDRPTQRSNQRRSRSRDLHYQRHSQSYDSHRRNPSSAYKGNNYSTEYRSQLDHSFERRDADESTHRKQENVKVDDNSRRRKEDWSGSSTKGKKKSKRAKISKSSDSESSSTDDSSDASSKGSTPSSSEPRKREKKPKKSKSKKHKSKTKHKK
ncbi:peptidyl-prolyl cis-trans isomerase sig-7 isoform X1 [Drosophila sulfurigaster albostrigata]|uniref:peptidyl-prolyl cis-trans isomerase sig-7 isoform X1 n=1 Tax=Drosophila sulfurigaster albostrigata TaxID=89887 RepID=UPI002D21AEA2|nr:peptidyl-prolyl cis-trans isomerase sig-7 isoform X1 [Drosophila sulfurigaster albostrigata]